MSAAPSSGSAPPPKPAASNDKNAPPSKDGKPAAALEEDDEFEDFPVESMLPTRRGIVESADAGRLDKRGDGDPWG